MLGEYSPLPYGVFVLGAGKSQKINLTYCFLKGIVMI